MVGLGRVPGFWLDAATEGVDEAGEFVGGVRGVGRIENGVEAHELIEHLSGGEAEAGFVEAAGLGGGEDIGGEAGLGGQSVEPFLLEEPILIAALFPFADVVGLNVLPMLTELKDDFGIGRPSRSI